MATNENSVFSRRAPLLILGGLMGLLLTGAILLLSSPSRGEPLKLAAPANMRVHVAGAVHRPGVYELPIGSIVEDAIQLAGGLSADASEGRINLAGSLQDGQQVFVPADSEPAPASSSVDEPSLQIAVNSAAAPQLERLPGIGPVLAQRIVEYRELNGPFQSIEDLLEVEGIGPIKLESLARYLVVP